MSDDHREFLTYLRKTLIPDLHESGRHETAEDFETAARFIERLGMTPEERVTAAFEDWVRDTDPPPIGMSVSEWISIALHADITDDELNEVGRKHWGRHWPATRVTR